MRRSSISPPSSTSSGLRMFLALTALVSCSSSSGATSGDYFPAPIPPDPAKKYDVSITAAQLGSQQRLIHAYLQIGGATTCAEEVVAGCVVRTCDVSTSAPAPAILDGGTFTASSPSLGADVPLMKVPDGAELGQAGAFADGEQVRIRSTGGVDLPVFDQTVTLPPNLTALSIDGCNGEGSTTCTLASAGSTLAWTGGAGATVFVGVQSMTGIHKVIVTCRFDGSAGRGWFPGAAIAKLTGILDLRLDAGVESAMTLVSGPKYTAGVFGYDAPSVGSMRVQLGP